MANPSDADIRRVNRFMGKAAADSALGDVANVRVYESSASAGGAASEQLTVTGLASDDQVLSVYQSVAGANSLALVAVSAIGTDTADAEWTADPGAGAKVSVVVRKAALGL